MAEGAGPASLVPGFTAARLRLVLGALMLSVFLSSMESTIVSTALPTIAGEFNAFESFAWVGTAYIVASTVSTPLLGKLSDLFGRRVVFQSTMAVFFVGSLLCGLARSMDQLIAFRAVQGVGGGAIQALAFAVVGDILPPRERGRYIGFFTMSFAVAAVAGPLLGGFIIQHWSWEWIFLCNLPLVALAGAITHVALRLPFTRRQARIDWLGAGLLAGGVGIGLIALERGPAGWTEPLVLGGFVASVVLIVGFVLQERRASEPMLPLRLFRNRVVLACCALGVVVSSFSYGASNFLPLYFQDVLFVSPTESGLRMLPIMAGVVIMSTTSGRLIARTGRYRIYPILGTLVMGLGVLALTQISGDSSYVSLAVAMFLLGLGSGMVYPVTSIATQNACELRDMGVATASLMFFRSLGGSLGLAVFGTILNSTIRAELPARTGLSADEAVSLIRAPEDIAALPAEVRSSVVDVLAQGISTIYWVCAAVMVIGVVWAFLLPELPLRGKAGITDKLSEPAASAAH